MKKNIPIYIMCLWAALSLAACTDEADETAWPPGGMPLQLSVAIEDFAGNVAATRATSENRWEGGETVAVCEMMGHGGIVKSTYIVQDDGRLTPQGEGLRAWANPYEERTFYALCPSHTPIMLSLATDQSGDGYQNTDYMLARLITVKAPDASKTLTFYHLSAKVVVHLRAGKGVTDKELRTATVTFENLKTTVNGYYHGNPDKLIDSKDVEDGSYTVTPNEVNPAASGYVRTVRALLMQQNIWDKKFVKIVTADGKIFYYTPGRKEVSLIAGKQYEFRLTVTSEGITGSIVEGGTWLPVD